MIIVYQRETETRSRDIIRIQIQKTKEQQHFQTQKVIYSKINVDRFSPQVILKNK